MELTRRSLFIYVLLVFTWLLVAGWQVEEHQRVKESARTDLRNRSKDIANTLSALIRAMRFRGTVFPERLESVLNELVYGRTNELVKSSGLISIVLLNAAGEPLASAGKLPDLEQKDILQKGEHWGAKTVTLVNPVDLGAIVNSEGVTNPTVISPPFRELTNANPDAFRGRSFPRREARPDEAGRAATNVPPSPDEAGGAVPAAPLPTQTGPSLSNSLTDAEVRPPPPARADARSREPDGRPRRPWMFRNMDEKEYQSLVEKRALHGLVLAMSTESVEAATLHDLWLRSVILSLATALILGSGLVWRNLAKVSDLQIRLVRASELTTHLKEMNLAAAGLAHETRNPLNIIRGLAQMISKQSDTASEIRQKSRAIVDEADKVAAQLNEFINYSRPREVRRSPLTLNSVVNEVVRALSYDLEEKKIQLQVNGDPLTIEADEQMLRQALFNLILNAIQAVDGDGDILIHAQKTSTAEGILEVRDNGPGVPAENRAEIFKPYFTTQKQGTGLGLAVVQQIVLAHGWEIECLANQPKGALFRISHLKLSS
jgi:signal transduction histidine kinase